MAQRDYRCRPWRSRHRSGLSYFAYTQTLFNGMVGEDGTFLRGKDGQGKCGKCADFAPKRKPRTYKCTGSV